jgi:hypothetical protein
VKARCSLITTPPNLRSAVDDSIPCGKAKPVVFDDDGSSDEDLASGRQRVATVFGADATTGAHGAKNREKVRSELSPLGAPHGSSRARGSFAPLSVKALQTQH